MPRASARAMAASRVLPASVMLVAAVSPFELALPGSIGGFTLTSVELAIVVSLALGVAAWWRDPSAFSTRTPITLPLIALAATAVIASLLAPELTGDALRVTARYAVAIALFVLVANVASNRHYARQIVAALLAAGAIVGV